MAASNFNQPALHHKNWSPPTCGKYQIPCSKYGYPYTYWSLYVLCGISPYTYYVESPPIRIMWNLYLGCPVRKEDDSTLKLRFAIHSRAQIPWTSTTVSSKGDIPGLQTNDVQLWGLRSLLHRLQRGIRTSDRDNKDNILGKTGFQVCFRPFWACSLSFACFVIFLSQSARSSIQPLRVMKRVRFAYFSTFTMLLHPNEVVYTYLVTSIRNDVF